MDILPTFLKGIREHVVAGDGETLSQWLLAEPDSPPVYFALGQELRRRYPKTGAALRNLIEKSLPEGDDPPEGGNSPWAGFHAFVHEFLIYWRDVNFGDLMDVHERLLALSTYVTGHGRGLRHLSLLPSSLPSLACTPALTVSSHLEHVCLH